MQANTLQHQFLAALSYLNLKKERINPDPEQIHFARKEAKDRAGRFLSVVGNDPKYSAVAKLAEDVIMEPAPTTLFSQVATLQ